ncbi:MAG: lipid A biosynthesis acyltransferase [Bacteroidetes bacterium]|nr:MAG: lipid A biosynthesis acyltransferase [Bacteroidota bacterium]
MLYRVARYRRRVVAENLARAFPEETPARRLEIERRFYAFFCDLLVESVKTLTISPEKLRQRVVLKNMDLFENYFRAGQNLLVVMGHLGNWEWAGGRFAGQSPFELQVIYRPLQNRWFDRLVFRMRARLGMTPVPMRQTLRTLLAHREKKTITTFIADQTPPPETAHWMRFLNQETPVFTGAEKLAVRLGYPVVFAGVRRLRRGFYEVYFEELTTAPTRTSPAEITEKFNRRLERAICEQPEIWLWSHRRWKHRKRENTKP